MTCKLISSLLGWQVLPDFDNAVKARLGLVTQVHFSFSSFVVLVCFQDCVFGVVSLILLTLSAVDSEDWRSMISSRPVFELKQL